MQHRFVEQNMTPGTASISIPRQIGTKAAPLVIVFLATMAVRSAIAANYPLTALLLFIWIVADTMTLTLMARAPDHKPAAHAVIGVLAAACITVWLAIPAALERELLRIPPLTAIMAAVVSVHIGWASLRAVRTFQTSGTPKDKWIAAASELLPPFLIRMAVAELSVIHMALFRWGGPADVPVNSHAFTYHKHLTPMCAALLALSAIEVAAYHLLIGRWSQNAAMIMFALSDVGLIYLVGLIKSFRFRPILMTPEGIHVRTGLLIDQVISLDAIAGVETSFTGTDIHAPETFNAALLAWPNVLLRLDKPLSRHSILRRRSFTAIAFRLDDPEAFMRILEWRLGVRRRQAQP